MTAEKQTGFVAILTPIDVDAKTPFEIAPGHWLRKASADERHRFKERLDRYNVWGAVGNGNPYEFEAAPATDGTTPQTWRALRPLPEEGWRYWVIAFEGNNEEVGEIESACELIGPDLHFAFTFFSLPWPGGDGWSPHFPVVPRCLDPMFAFTAAKRLTEGDLSQIRQNYEAVKKLPEDLGDIGRTLRLIRELRRLDLASDFRAIGLFTAIETLLVHNPSGVDAHDSINHQVASKIPLLQRRFPRPVDFSSFFPKMVLKQPSAETAWRRLYDYRSRVVHGGPLDGRLKELRDSSGRVNEFLWETVKCLIQLGLEDPQFLADLKRC